MNAKVFVEREQNSRLRLVNTTGATVEKEEFVILGGISGVALERIENGKVGAFHVEEGIVLQIGQADIASGAVFPANSLVYYDNGEFGSAKTGHLVGQVTEPLTSGVIRFAKFFKAEEV